MDRAQVRALCNAGEATSAEAAGDEEEWLMAGRSKKKKAVTRGTTSIQAGPLLKSITPSTLPVSPLCNSAVSIFCGPTPRSFLLLLLPCPSSHRSTGMLSALTCKLAVVMSLAGSLLTCPR